MAEDRCFYCKSLLVQDSDGRRTWCPTPNCRQSKPQVVQPGNLVDASVAADTASLAAKAMATAAVTQLAKALGEDPDQVTWPELLYTVSRLKEESERKLKVQEVIGLLRGMDVMVGFMDRIELQLSDEAVYEHLKTCASVVDDEDTKQKLYDFAELFAFEFCK